MDQGTKGPRDLGMAWDIFLKNGRANNMLANLPGHHGCKGKGPLRIQFLGDDTKKEYPLVR